MNLIIGDNDLSHVDVHDDDHDNDGVRRLMEFLGNVVPFVSEMPKVHNTRGEEVSADSDGPTSLYFFKTGMEPHIGKVPLARGGQTAIERD